MKFTAKELEDNAVELTIEVPAEDLLKGEKRALKKISEQLSIPGFRKGKAPKNIVERQVGKDYIMQSAFDLVYPQAVNDALKEGNYDPVTRVEVDAVTLEHGKDLVFTANFTEHPQVTLGQYKGLEVERPKVEPIDDEVSAELESVRYEHSTLADAAADDVTADGDLVTLDFEGFKDGVAFDGGTAQDYILELGNGEFISGFEDQLIGLKSGDEKEVNVTFPEDYHVKELAGSPALFKCKIKSFKKRTLPELNDEFVASLNGSAKTVEELRTQIKNRLSAAAERDANNKWIDAVIEKATANMTVDIPEIMIEDELDHIMRVLEMRLAEQNIKVENYFSMLNSDAGQYREGQREQAEKNVRINLMLEAVAKEENIEVTKDDMATEVLIMAAAYHVSPNEVMKVINDQGEPARRNLQLTALHKKVAQFIFHSVPGNEIAKEPQDKSAADKPADEADKA